jgi:uncharacterized membrane protein
MTAFRTYLVVVLCCLALGVVAFVGGMMFLAPYLLWASAQARGDTRILLLGNQRAAD